jgi:hypothetical protein
MSPAKLSNDVESSRSCQQVQSFGCGLPRRHVTLKFWEMPEHASQVPFVQKIIPENFKCQISMEIVNL